MQLVAYGAQDVYLTGNPQITFFKTVYRRHTNFSMESIIQTFDGNADFGNKVTATIARNGDLIHRMYLEHDAEFEREANTANFEIGHVEHYGHSLIKECEIEIGGQRIDKHYAMWNRVWSDLTEFNPSGHFGVDTALNGNGVTVGETGTLYQYMTGNGLGVNTEDKNTSANDFGASADGNINGFDYLENAAGVTKAKITVNKIFLPLNFWFCRNPGLSLPLIALQYHEVKVIMTFEELSNLVRTTDTADFDTDVSVATADNLAATIPKNFDLYCDYIYLDTDERRRFAQVSHEYLIEQVQRQEFTLTSNNETLNINLNHPVKEIIWTTRNEKAGATAGRCQPIDTGTSGDQTASPVSLDQMGGNWQLKLNGQDRFKERDTKYFTRTQVWQHHTGHGSVSTFGIGGSDLDSDTATSCGGDSIAVYSFALKPEEHQPSGTCNFSRIDSAQLVGTDLKVAAAEAALTDISDADANQTALTLFAVNYNVLRIMSGMGGLAYSN